MGSFQIGLKQQSVPVCRFSPDFVSFGLQAHAKVQPCDWIVRIDLKGFAYGGYRVLCLSSSCVQDRQAVPLWPVRFGLGLQPGPWRQ